MPQRLLQGDDSTSDKITGSIINAAIFVGVIAVMTFLLVLLFKYGVSLLCPFLQRLSTVQDHACRSLTVLVMVLCSTPILYMGI